ncbi:hypothetical protein SDC9_80291 [bioreactor metagenome]|uniref:Uncharacterized protein n=1 Tax=bioreactor metagenome TaxID=1076179 RepID=A0A644Z4S2_9ZZZZ
METVCNTILDFCNIIGNTRKDIPFPVGIKVTYMQFGDFLKQCVPDVPHDMGSHAHQNPL